jgi:hypothetical protein
VAVFFDIAYALAIAVALFVAGSIPGLVLGALVPLRERLFLLPGIALAVVGWIWIGWIGGRYGISRAGLVLFSGIGAAGFIRGWLLGLELGASLRATAASWKPAGRGSAERSLGALGDRLDPEDTPDQRP